MKDTSKPIAIFSAKSAIKDYNKKLAGFGEFQNRLKRYDSQGNQIDKMTGSPVQSMIQQPDLNTHLTSQGLPATFSSKQALARQHGFNDYYGSSQQDERLMMGLQAKGMNESAKTQSDREYGLKEKEFALKEKSMSESKMPTADEVASSLLASYKNK